MIYFEPPVGSSSFLQLFLVHLLLCLFGLTESECVCVDEGVQKKRTKPTTLDCRRHFFNSFFYYTKNGIIRRDRRVYKNVNKTANHRYASHGSVPVVIVVDL